MQAKKNKNSQNCITFVKEIKVHIFSGLAYLFLRRGVSILYSCQSAFLCVAEYFFFILEETAA